MTEHLTLQDRLTMLQKGLDGTNSIVMAHFYDQEYADKSKTMTADTNLDVAVGAYAPKENWVTTLTAHSMADFVAESISKTYQLSEHDLVLATGNPGRFYAFGRKDIRDEVYRLAQLQQ